MRVYNARKSAAIVLIVAELASLSERMQSLSKIALWLYYRRWRFLRLKSHTSDIHIFAFRTSVVSSYVPSIHRGYLEIETYHVYQYSYGKDVRGVLRVAESAYYFCGGGVPRKGIAIMGI